MAAFYLLVGLDFEIFQYQFESRIRKLVLILLVGGSISTAVVIFNLSLRIDYLLLQLWD